MVVILSILSFLSALVAQFLGKFFVALFMQPLSTEKRLRCATLSTTGCAFAAPFASLLVSVVHPGFNEYYWLFAMLVFFLSSAVIDTLILAPYKRQGLKTAILYFTVDFLVANLCVLFTRAMSFDFD
jgi:hypothetical protein